MEKLVRNYIYEKLYGNNSVKIEGCIDDERQFKTAIRSQAAADATVLKRGFRDNFVIFRHRFKCIALLE